MIALKARLKRSDSIVYRQIGTETILVPIRGSAEELKNIYTLNEVGRRIWQLLDGQKTVGAICKDIVAEFEVGDDVAQKDVRDFLEEMLALKTVEEVKEAGE